MSPAQQPSAARCLCVFLPHCLSACLSEVRICTVTWFSPVPSWREGIIAFSIQLCLGIPSAVNTPTRLAMQAACSRLAGRVAAHGAASSSCISLGRRQGALGTPLACGLATMVRPPSVRDAQTRIFGWAQPDVRRGESRQGHAPLKTLEKLKRHGLIGQKVRARSCVPSWRDLHTPLEVPPPSCLAR